MADMKLAIKIDEEDYKKLTKYGEPLPCGNLFRDGIMKAVANGTPLPKGCDIQRIIPKIITCKECKHNGTMRCKCFMYDGNEYMSFHNPDFYCKDAERIE